jgi:hypothetical protein
MTHVDDAIRRALSPADVEAYEALRTERSPFGEVLGMFQSQRRAYVWAVALAGSGFLALAAYAAWRLTTAVEVRDMLAWGLLAIFAMLTLALIKLWFWLELQRNEIVREVRRLELQIAAFSASKAP